jgi:hypothetical protein
MDETQGAEFHSPYPNRSGCQHTGEAFVDDTALWILRMGLMFMMLTNLMQQRLHNAGHGLSTLPEERSQPPQVFLVWGTIQWYYTATGIPRMCKIQANNPTIDVSAGDDPILRSTQSIKCVEVLTKGKRTLGVRLAPDGNDYDEFKHCMEEATMTMRDRLNTAPLNRESMLPWDSALSGR